MRRYFYLFCRFVMWFLYRSIWRVEFMGQDHIPRTGRLLIAANHRSFADPPLIGCAAPREVHFLAKKELFSFKPFGVLISALNAHPLSRRVGKDALRMAADLLDQEQCVIVFPEGSRMKTDQLGKGRSGVGHLSFKTHSPVIPAYIHNSGHMVQLKKLMVLFGPPLFPSHFNSYEDMVDEIMKQIQRLKEEIVTKRIN